MYCFLDKACAYQAVSWGGHFRPENLAELSLNMTPARDQLLDANWITYGPRGTNRRNDVWMGRYWNGEPCPAADPVWELIVEGRFSVLDTELRERSYRVVKDYWPNSLMLLEISRLGACIGSNIGSMNVFMEETKERYEFKYLLDMRDARDRGFLDRIGELMKSGCPVNWADIRPHFEQDSFGCTPDMTALQFSVPRDYGIT